MAISNASARYIRDVTDPKAGKNIKIWTLSPLNFSLRSYRPNEHD
jgi:hypothetical protein